MSNDHWKRMEMKPMNEAKWRSFSVEKKESNRI